LAGVIGNCFELRACGLVGGRDARPVREHRSDP
jgi:hypothetical protein